MATAGQDYIGPYRLLRLVRAGQTCQIWEAINSTDNRRIALKALQRDYRQNKDELALLKHEYLVGKDLDHPYVIRIYDCNVAGTVPYLVLEYFNAPNLKQALRMDVEKLRLLISGAVLKSAQALAYLHDQGWIHCDVKPDNVLMNENGDVRLIDFAIATRVRRGLGRWFGGRIKVQGTRSYMSPEQIRGEVVDVRTDIYSFACMIYELVGGKLPYTAESANELLNKHLTAVAPPLVSLNPLVSPPFSQLIAKMMAKRPQERPASFHEFLEQMEKIRVFRVRPQAT